jgi:hypothetical protein
LLLTQLDYHAPRLMGLLGVMESVNERLQSSSFFNRVKYSLPRG